MDVQCRGAGAGGNRRRQRTRAAILGAGQRLFASRPLESVTIDEIVDAAEVAKGSFYNHFGNKKDLAQEIHRLVEGDVEFHVFVANRDVIDPPERIVRGLCVVVRYAMEHQDRLQALLTLSGRDSVNSPLNIGLTTDVQHGLDAGRLREVDPDTAVQIVLGLALQAIRHTVQPEATALSIQTIAANMGAAVLRAQGLEHTEARTIAHQAARTILAGASFG